MVQIGMRCSLQIFTTPWTCSTVVAVTAAEGAWAAFSTDIMILLWGTSCCCSTSTFSLPSRARNFSTAALNSCCVTPRGNTPLFCSDMDQTPSGLDRKGNEAAIKRRAGLGNQRSGGRTTGTQRTQQITDTGGPLVSVALVARCGGQLAGRGSTAQALLGQLEAGTAAMQLAAQLACTALGTGRIEQTVTGDTTPGGVLAEPFDAGAGAARHVHHQGGTGIIQQADQPHLPAAAQLALQAQQVGQVTPDLAHLYRRTGGPGTLHEGRLFGTLIDQHQRGASR